ELAPEAACGTQEMLPSPERQLVDAADRKPVRKVLCGNHALRVWISRVQVAGGLHELRPGIARLKRVARGEAALGLHLQRVVPGKALIVCGDDARKVGIGYKQLRALDPVAGERGARQKRKEGARYACRQKI